MQNQIQVFNIKISLVGDYNSGKRRLLEREVHDEFESLFNPAIGWDFKKKKYIFGNSHVNTTIWIPSGAQRFKKLSNLFYKSNQDLSSDSRSILFCFDLNKNNQVKEVQSSGYQNCKYYLVGCKSDLQPVVQMEQILQFCEQFNLTYLQTSAKQNYGVHQSFSIVVTDALNREKLNPTSNKDNLKLVQPGKKSLCF